MERFIFDHGTYGKIVYRKSAEELEKEAVEAGAKVILKWVEDGRLFKIMQLEDDELWRFEYLLEGEAPLNAEPGRLIPGRKESSMSDAMLKEWLEKYNALERRSDHYWDKMVAAEASGNADKVRKYAERMSESDAERRGMLMALSIFGYTVVYQDSKPKVVTNC